MNQFEKVESSDARGIAPRSGLFCMEYLTAVRIISEVWEAKMRILHN